MPRIRPVESPVTIELDGDQIQAREGESVAAALLAHGERVFARSPKYHRPRGPFCLSGACSHCLMRVDGVPNVATCTTPVKAGMRIEHQNAMPDRRVDLFRANDFIFREWFNHHEFLAGVPLAEAVMLKVARKLSGLGFLADQPAPDRPPAVTETLSMVIVGGGAAGLAAAQRLQERGIGYVLFEREHELGGRLAIAAEVDQPTVWQPPAEHVRTRAQVVGLFADEGTPFLVVLQEHQLHFVYFDKLLLAVGGHAVLPTFPNNDLPGVMWGRAVSRLIRQGQVMPGRRIACVGEATEAKALAELVARVGGEAVAVGAQVERVHGISGVSAVTVTPGGKVDCDVVALCEPPSPAFELARAAGAKVSWSPEARSFVVETEPDGRTARRAVWLAGEIRGPMSSRAAAEQGRVAADSMVGGAS
jgi:sarcosine oxidase subunit alpha